MERHTELWAATPIGWRTHSHWYSCSAVYPVSCCELWLYGWDWTEKPQLYYLVYLYPFFSFSVLHCISLESLPSSAVLKEPGETVSLSCKGSGFTFKDYAMYWIRQADGNPLKWMGFIYTDGSKTVYSSSIQERIEITRNNPSSMVYLKLSSLRAEDSAMYYCARSHSDRNTPVALQIHQLWVSIQSTDAVHGYSHRLRQHRTVTQCRKKC